MKLVDLKLPFPPDAVHWRVGSTTKDKTRGLALAYIDARDVMDRLDEVCGPDGWQNRYTAVGGRIVCEIGIEADEQGNWVWKSDGAGDTDFEPEKGGLSDAFKRAAVQWGVGRYLYDLPTPWVDIEAAGRSFRIKDSERKRLATLLASDAPTGPVEAPRHSPALVPPYPDPPRPSPPSGAPGPIKRLSRSRAKSIMQAMHDAPDLDALAELWERSAAEIMTATPAGQKAILAVYHDKWNAMSSEHAK